MFDFSKMAIEGTGLNDLLNNQFLKRKFVTIVDTNGEIKKQIAEIESLKFIIVNNTHVNLNGSFHKYFNSGIHNYNDFSISNLVEVLIDLSNKFHINPYLTRLHNLEFGVNVILPFDTNIFLNSILSYKGREYEKETFTNKGYLIRFSFDHYELKIYNKAIQYGLTTNTLRFEIKVKKMQYFEDKGIGVSMLCDLLKPEVYGKLIKQLLKALTELVIYDNSIILNELPEKEKDLLTNGSNPKFWIAQKKSNCEDFKYKRKRFKFLVKKYGKQNLQETVSNLIENKWNVLTNINTSSEQKITEYLNLFSITKFPELTTFKKSNTMHTPQINQLNEVLNLGI